jgi:hypothetical protein
VKALLSSLRHLILGETWTIPLGVGASLALAVLVRAVVSAQAWHTAGGFVLAVLIATALTISLRTRT